MGICSSPNTKKSKNNQNTDVNTNPNDSLTMKKITGNENNKNIEVKEDHQKNDNIETKKFPNSERIYDLHSKDLDFLENFKKNYQKRNFPKGEYIFNKKLDNKILNESDKLSTKVELFISLLNLKNDSLNYSVKVFICNNKKYGQFDFLKETEQNLGFEIFYGTTFLLDYYFEKEQIIRCQIMEEGKKISIIEFSVSYIMGSQNFKCIKKIINQNSKNEIGEIELTLKQIDNTLENTISEFSDIEFEFNENDNYERFFILNNYNDGKVWRPCYKSMEFKLNNNRCKLKKIRIDSFFLRETENQNIIMEIYKTTDSYPSSYAQFSLNNINSPIIIYKKLNKTNITNNNNNNNDDNNIIGKITLVHKLIKKLTFIDYLKKGIDINLDIAIDYTISNGKPNEKKSLHYDGEEPNDYEKAILSCGKIVGYYDRDQIFPVYGFGGIPKNEKAVNHCFNINFQESPDIKTIDEVIRVYKKSLKEIKFSGPTFFSPIIIKVMEEISLKIEKHPKDNYYEILMILTDGIINDMKETIKLLIDCANLPLSVIIIGIGKSDFTNMIVLDGDEFPLTDCNGRVTRRDLVQFVQYEQFKQGGKEELAEEVLKEIPRQVEEYYSLTGNFNEKVF